MLSQETDHVSPTEVIPELGKGALDTWRPHGCLGGRLDKTGDTQLTVQGGEAVGKPGGVGADTHQRLNLSKPWEGPRRICQDFKPYSGDPTVRHYRGASGNVRHGEIVTPSRDRKSENGNPSPTAGRARILSRRSSRQCRESSRVGVPVPPIACLQAVSISDTRGGNEPRSARM
jgi:hypothetical protein